MSVNTQLVTVTIDDEEFDCLLTLGDYVQTRAKQALSCMSDNNSVVALGSIARDPMQFDGLYDEVPGGQDELKKAFSTNSRVFVKIEFANSPAVGSNGTTIEGYYGVGAYTLTNPKDGKVGVSFSLEFMEEPALIPAGALGARAHSDITITGVGVGDGNVGVNIDGLDYTYPVTAGDTTDDAYEKLTAILSPANYSPERVDDMLRIFAPTYGTAGNSISIADTTTDTGLHLNVTNFNGGFDPI